MIKIDLSLTIYFAKYNSFFLTMMMPQIAIEVVLETH
jgi:hypothetical protein